jgi:XTP/dITP diphosphohydrolase
MAHRRLSRGEKIVIATHNAGKLREVAALLAPHGIEVISAGALGLPEPEETETSFLGNARIKAHAAARAAGMPALSDDSGFSVAALDGAPGVYTADWAMRPEGGRDYALAMGKVHELAKHASDRAAWFTCALVLAWPDGHEEGFEGKAKGVWVWPPRGAVADAVLLYRVHFAEGLAAGRCLPAAGGRLSFKGGEAAGESPRCNRLAQPSSGLSTISNSFRSASLIMPSSTMALKFTTLFQ